MSTRAIATSTLWQIASQATMAILSAVSVKFVALGLSKELAGAYNTSYGYLQLFAILADFGLYAVSVREVSAAKDKTKVLGGLVVLRSVIATLSLGSAVLIAWVVPSWQGTPLPIGITIAAFVPFFTLLAGVLRTVFQVTFKMHYVFIAEVLQRVLTTALMAVIVIGGARMSSDIHIYEWFLWVGAAGSILLFVLSTFFALRLMPVRPVFEKKLLLKLLKASAPYGVAFLCIALYRQFDLTLIAALRSDHAIQNAYYGFASRVSEMTYLVPTFLLNSTLPILSERSAKGQSTKTLLGKTLLLVLTFGAASSIFSFFWARPIISFLTTDAYMATATTAGTDTALQMLAAPMFLNGIVLYSFYVLLAKHEWKSLVLCMMTAVGISLYMNSIWIPLEGFVGAIQTATLVHIFLVITLFPLAVRAMPLSIPRNYIISWIIFSLMLGSAASMTAPYLTNSLSSGVGLFLGALAAAAIAWLVGIHKIFAVGSQAKELQIPTVIE